MTRFLIGWLLVLLATTSFATPKIISSIYPLQQIANEIAGEPTGLIAESFQSPHKYSIKPSKARAIVDADLVIWIGEVMMPQLEKYIQRRKGTTITAAKLANIKLLSADKDHDHAHEHGKEKEKEKAFSYDPHLWLSTDNAKVIAQAIADALIKKDPANAEKYKHNLAKFEQKLTDLSASIKASFKQKPPSNYYVFHNAYRYFEDEFGIKHSGVIREHAGQSPKTRHLNDLKKELQQSASACLFHEPQFNSPIVDKLVEGAKNVSVAVLDPIGYHKDKNIGYATILRNIALQLSNCNKKPPTIEQHAPHEHGAANLTIAIDANKMEIDLESPADNIFGFEYIPSTEADKNTVKDAVNQLKAANKLFTLPEAAKCHLDQVNVSSAILEKKPVDENNKQQHAHNHAHNDVDVSWHYSCQSGENLDSITPHFFTIFSPRFKHLKVEWLTPAGVSSEIMTSDKTINFKTDSQ